MSYTRQAFGKSSEDRVSGLITKANVNGFVGGLIGGLALGAMLLGIRWSAMLLALVLALIGFGLSIRISGLSVFERGWLRFGYTLRRWVGATLVPPSTQPLPSMQDRTIIVDGEVLARPYQPKQS